MITTDNQQENAQTSTTMIDDHFSPTTITTGVVVADQDNDQELDVVNVEQDNDEMQDEDEDEDADDDVHLPFTTTSPPHVLLSVAFALISVITLHSLRTQSLDRQCMSLAPMSPTSQPLITTSWELNLLEKECLNRRLPVHIQEHTLKVKLFQSLRASLVFTPTAESCRGKLESMLLALPSFLKQHPEIMTSATSLPQVRTITVDNDQWSSVVSHVFDYSSKREYVKIPFQSVWQQGDGQDLLTIITGSQTSPMLKLAKLSLIHI